MIEVLEETRSRDSLQPRSAVLVAAAGDEDDSFELLGTPPDETVFCKKRWDDEIQFLPKKSTIRRATKRIR